VIHSSSSLSSWPSRASTDLAAATGRLPHLTGWLAHPAGLPPDEQFSLGLGFLLDGIARCLAGAETQARSDTMGR
jgi:hypothetical protein